MGVDHGKLGVEGADRSSGGGDAGDGVVLASHVAIVGEAEARALHPRGPRLGPSLLLGREGDAVKLAPVAQRQFGEGSPAAANL